MRVSELLAALEDVSPDAEVRLWGCRGPHSQCPPEQTEGELLYIAISNVDGTDRLVVFSNCIEDSRGNPVFKAPPQIKRFRVNTKDGLAAAAADLREQAFGETTEDLRTQLEVKRVKAMFNNFDKLLRSKQQEDPDA